MTTTITKRAIPPPREAPNRQAIEALATATNELSGAIGDAMQRAVRVCELVDAGILALMPNGQLGRNESIDEIGLIDISDVTGLTAALAGKVAKAGDTMSGPLVVNANVTIGGGGRLTIGSVGGEGGEILLSGFGGSGGDAVFDSNGDLFRWFGHPSAKVLSWNRSSGVFSVPGPLTVTGDGNPGNGFGLTALQVSGSYGGGIRFLDGAMNAGIYTTSGPDLRFGVAATTGALTEMLRLTPTRAHVYGKLDATDIIATRGGNAMLAFDRRDVPGDVDAWGWYASGVSAHLWKAGIGERFSVDHSGNASIPGSATILGQTYCHGWFRTQEFGEGWYHEAGGGGWNMTDGDWVRCYNGKGVLISGGPSGRQLHLEGTSVSLQVYDTDRATYSWLHYNDGQFGFLAENSFSWAAYRDPGNNWGCIGNITAYASDARLKTNIVDGGYDEMDALFRNFRMREYDWDRGAIEQLNPGFNPKATHEFGAIAQEVEAYAPWMVATHMDGIRTIMWDKAVPALLAKVQQLESRLARMEAEHAGP